MARVFVDTNVFLRHVMEDHALHSPLAKAFFVRVERGEVRARTADTVIFEAVFTLEKQYRKSRDEIRENLLLLLELPAIELPEKHRVRRAFDLYVDINISFADAYHVALMEQLGIEEIASFDKDFDRVPGITRVEPS